MIHLLFGAAIAAPLVAFVVPLVAISRLHPGTNQTDVIARIRRPKGGTETASDFERAWSRNEFAFARAIDAYEDLIDSTAGRLQ